MNDSNSSPDSTQQKFSKRQERRTLSIILIIAATLLIGIPGILIGTYLGNKWILIATAIVCCALNVAISIYAIINWQCPSCNYFLGRNIQIKYCLNCGVELQ